MTESVPPAAGSNGRVHRGAHERGRASDAEIERAVRRASRVADGLALLERAPLECASVLLGIAPPAIERVRDAFQDALARDAALVLFSRAAGRLPEAVAPQDPRPAAPRDGEQLLAAARQRPGGLAVLLGAAPECAAIVFGVHPDLVHGARELAARRGLTQDLPNDA